MSPRVLFEQDLETLKNKVSEMGEHAEISYDHMLYGIRENKEDILKTLLDTDHKMVDMQRSIEAMRLSLLHSPAAYLSPPAVVWSADLST